MTRRAKSWLRAGAVIGLVLAFGCKRAEEEADTCEDDDAPAAATTTEAPSDATPADASRASAALEKAASEAKSSPGAAAPDAAAQDPEAARKAMDAMLQDVRKQLEQKAAELGKIQTNEPPKP